MTKLCGIEGCNRPHAARGLCATCYARCNREGAFQTRVRVKLDPAKAKQIRALRSRGVLAREVALKFGISLSTVDAITARRIWK